MFPIRNHELAEALSTLGIASVAGATIRQMVSLAGALEQIAGEPYVHLEIGNPGLPAEEIGVEAQRAALADGVASRYPDIAGIPQLKKAAERFVKAFLNVDIPGKCLIPTVGSMQGGFTLQLLLGQRLPGRDTILFIDPGFPAQHHQAKVLGLEQRSLDIYHHRGAALEQALEEMVADGRVTAILYSNPNNPTWVNLTDVELQCIARVADRHDIIVIEDHAYMGMDFRRDFSHPGVEPFIPTVAHYTTNCVLLLSASKIFSYAGERIALVAMTPEVYSRHYDALKAKYDIAALGDAFVFAILYAASSGTSHSAQHALAAMLNAAADGTLPFVEHAREYGRRAELVKKAFLDNGFHIVYDRDGDRPIADGFFFTVGYQGMDGDTLQEELLKHGISAINLTSTYSRQPGVRVTVSTVGDDATIALLNNRLKRFHDEHTR